MLHITKHAIERYVERVIGMTEEDARSITPEQYTGVRALLSRKLKDIKLMDGYINHSEWNCRLVIRNNTLVTIIPR